ncbi:hypothetical protein Ssed_1495 [Shewanella sediminis HAW-EB3]|uniref:Lipoprotein n=1 Tax=Shewanella sediminis (strain HAW-EB3) TaxID=425104 RepID=A8FTD3_SHESH|nr:hypothetical protein [Shewanella sediminis]ABV36106.1 hypothetical protein Ssed_1495 [Shewanella sediminis HAW-EB3]
MKLLKLPILLMTLIFSVACLAAGNPRPGFPHDTLIFHVKKAASGLVNCGDGGHAAFVRYVETDEGPVIVPVDIFITMVDWVGVDSDSDGSYHEDPADGIDNDGDGAIDEDGYEPGALTRFTDCDGLDNDIRLQMRDTDPRAGWISTQEWFIRGIGRPEQEFSFWTNADQMVCEVVDEEVVCSFSDDRDDWIELGFVSTASYNDEKCVKQVSLKGKNSKKGGGKTEFCDITEEFMVDIDVDGDLAFDGGDDDGDVDIANQFIFSVSCLDLTGDLYVVAPEDCELSRIIWEVDNSTTSKAKAQVFVGHTGEVKIQKGKIHGKHK